MKKCLIVCVCFIFCISLAINFTACESSDDEDSDDDDSNDDDNQDSWISTTVYHAEDLSSPSLAIDGSGFAHLSIWDLGLFSGGPSYLKYATNRSGIWTVEQVDSQLNIGGSSSLAGDEEGNMHVTYCSSNSGDKKLMYASRIKDTWEKQVLFADVNEIIANEAAIVLDGEGNAHIAYQAFIWEEDICTSALKLAISQGGEWTSQTLHEKEGTNDYRIFMIIDHAGFAHVIFWDIIDPYLYYATNKSGSWMVQTVIEKEDGFHDCTLVVNSDCQAYVGYAIEGRVMMATQQNDGWDVQTLLEKGSSPYLVLDTDNRLHFSYEKEWDLMYAQFGAGTWKRQTVSEDSYILDGTVMAIDNEMYAHISYIGDQDEPTLVYVTNRP